MKRSMSKEEFLALYQRQQSSGLTIKDFCDNESYPASCFHYWKKKYGLSHPYTKHTDLQVIRLSLLILIILLPFPLHHVVTGM